MILSYIVPVIGIGLIVFAMVWGKRLSQRRVEIALAKLGIDLKTDTLTLMILLGCAMASVGILFWYQGYEAQVNQLKGDLEQAEVKLQSMNDVLESFKVYSMRFHPVFPKAETVNCREVEVQVYICKQGKGPPQLCASETTVGFSNDLWVNVDNLNPGDKLRLVAYEGEGKSWESADVIEVPQTDIQLRRVP
jgi:hypothetical protein